jgi:rfaE bifunctional protein kinase chain/domain/rfaE bifunctional protein nucleotidyltransferase chain/domain
MSPGGAVSADNPAMLREGDATPNGGPGAKILSLDQLLGLRERARAEGRRVVQCHGCFDIVHPGHIRHLRFARAQGDVLLVSVTGDAGVGKGAGRPLIPQELRAENLAELDCVDWVHVCPEPTALSLLERVRPDVYIKGREYEHNKDPRFAAEREMVERGGGRVVFSSGDVVFSSTALVRALESSVDPFHGRLRSVLDDEELSAERLTALAAAFRGRRVVVVGEVILDTYVFCDRPDVAGESPVMTLRPVERRRFDGGAAVIARHAAALGASPILVTALPEDAEAVELRARLLAEGVDVRAVACGSRLPEKQRMLVGAQKMVKIDLVDPLVLDERQRDALVATAEGAAREVHTDAAIIADFGLGLLTPAVTERLARKLRQGAAVVTGDVSGRRATLRAMKGMDLVCPSEGELRDAFHNHAEGLPAVAWEMFSELGLAAAIVTMGAEGLVAFSRQPGVDAGSGWASRLRGEHVPAFSTHAVDALGCGDALLTTATLALAVGASLKGAAVLGAAAASVEARRLGNIPVSASDLRREVERVHAATLALDNPDVVAGVRPGGAGRRTA